MNLSNRKLFRFMEMSNNHFILMYFHSSSFDYFQLFREYSTSSLISRYSSFEHLPPSLSLPPLSFSSSLIHSHLFVMCYCLSVSLIFCLSLSLPLTLPLSLSHSLSLSLSLTLSFSHSLSVSLSPLALIIDLHIHIFDHYFLDSYLSITPIQYSR